MKLSHSIAALSLAVSELAKSNGTFESQGETIVYDLYRPGSSIGSTKLPIVVAGPGFPSVKELFFSAYGAALGDAGIALLVFDYPGFGASTGKQRQDVVIAQQHQTYTDAISLVSKDSRFDAQRVGVMGKSLSGAHSIYMAASDERLKAAVSIVPHIKASEGVVGSRVQFLDDIAADVEAKAAGGKRTMVKVFGPPGSKAIMTTDGAEGYLGPLLKRSNYKNEATASSLLEIASYDVSLKAKEVKIPILVATGNQDTITPPQSVLQAFDGVKSAKVLRLDGEHFTVTQLRKTILVEETVKFFRQNLQQ